MPRLKKPVEKSAVKSSVLTTYKNPMKKITILLACFIFCVAGFTSKAQTMGNLWGTNNEGGDSAGGVLFGFDPLTNNDSIKIPFSPISKAPATTEDPYGSLLLGADGNYYGTTAYGGVSGKGTIFKCTPAGVITMLHSFSGTDGATPYCNLIQCPNGMLYGMTDQGGLHNEGVIFKCSTDGKTYDTLHNFGNFTGDAIYPYYGNSLVLGPDGNLYGMTYQGGLVNDGAIFKCDTINGTGYDTLHGFTGNTNDGSQPYGNNLIVGKDGNLYGMTGYGGLNGDGVLFKCSTTGVFDTIHSFGVLSDDGILPSGNLVQGANGMLYGLTDEGGLNNHGAIFKCSTDGSIYDTLHSFGQYTGDGYYPYYGNGLAQASDGTLYGVSGYSGGGIKGKGVLFKCDTTNGSMYDTIYSFGYKANDGIYPYGSVIIGADGNLYVLTYEGGSMHYGAIDKYDLTTDTGGVFANFGISGPASISMLGNEPNGNFIQGKDGNLYGTAYGGGKNNFGTINKYNMLTGELTVLHSFNDTTDASNPTGSLVMDSHGDFYGLASSDNGSISHGSIFKITPSGTFTLLYSFTDGNDGGYPYGSLIFGKDGMLYGTTSNAGPNGSGTIFKCDTLGNETVVYGFTGGPDGSTPYGSLVQAKNGTLYGVTNEGGLNNGVVFKCDLAGNETVLHAFANRSDGLYPQGRLLFYGKDSLLYGMTYSGGNNNSGIIYKCDTTDGSQYTLLYNFGDADNGMYPNGSLILGSDSNIYGMTSSDNVNNYGEIFKTDTLGNITTLYSFTNGSDGYSPHADLTEIMSASASLSNATCSGTPVASSVRGFVAPLTYMWSNGSTTATDTIKTAGTYTVTVTDARGIAIQATVNVSTGVLAMANNSTSICAGSSTNLAVTTNGGIGATTFSWMPGSLSGSSPSVSPTSTTTYTATVTDTKGCKDSATETVTVNPLPSVTITGMDSIVITSNDTLVAHGATSYVWNTSATTDTLIVSPATQTTYTVTGTNGAGCSNQATFVVKVEITTGIASSSISGSTSAYPNPATQTLNLAFSAQGTTSAEIKIIDAMGKECINNAAVIENGKVLPIDISSLAPGAYFVRIVTEKQTQTVKFIKQ